MSTITLPHDSREDITKREYASIKHATHTAAKIVRHTQDAIRFYIGERKYMIETKCSDLGRMADGTVKDISYFDALIKKNQDDLRIYQVEYHTLAVRMAEIKPFIQAKSWIKDWVR